MKQIPLTQGKFALVDDDDYEFLSQWRWQFLNTGYAGRDEDRKKILMHRIIIKTPSGMSTDHIDGNKINNQRKNLRIALHAQNMKNMKKHLDSRSKYKGIYWDKENDKWRASICVNGKIKRLGRFVDEKEAALAYNGAAKKHHGEFAKLNEVF